MRFPSSTASMAAALLTLVCAAPLVERSPQLMAINEAIEVQTIFNTVWVTYNGKAEATAVQQDYAPGWAVPAKGTQVLQIPSTNAQPISTPAPIPATPIPAVQPITAAAAPTTAIESSQSQSLPTTSAATSLVAAAPTVVPVPASSNVVPSVVSAAASSAAVQESALLPSSSTPAPIPAVPTSTTLPAASSTPSAIAPAPAVSSSPAAVAGPIPFLRGVNLGGWLVLEKWMDSDAFTGAFANAVDQYTFDSVPGAAAALKTHWDTFFTQSDIQTIAATGINALRIPIGFWAYDNANTPYLTGADAYLDQAIGWARASNMKVWVDLHGTPGSQNGFDNSGHAGDVDWQQGNNLDRTVSVLQTIAKKYGANSYADVVVGIELVNEPISYGNNNIATTQSWAKTAYAAVKAAAENQHLVIVMHDAFETPLAWTDTATSLNANGQFGVDTHMYQLYDDSDNTLTQAQHITEACGWAANLKSANTVMPTYVGEWSAATNICVNPDGSTTAGTSCSVSGCQCQSVDYSQWNSNMVEQVRRFVEAQLDVFESSTSGYFMWAAKGPGGWGFLNGIENGSIPNPVTSRKYPGQCGSSSRRKVRGGLGVSQAAF